MGTNRDRLPLSAAVTSDRPPQLEREQRQRRYFCRFADLVSRWLSFLPFRPACYRNPPFMTQDCQDCICKCKKRKPVLRLPWLFDLCFLHFTPRRSSVYSSIYMSFCWVFILLFNTWVTLWRTLSNKYKVIIILTNHLLFLWQLTKNRNWT